MARDESTATPAPGAGQAQMRSGRLWMVLSGVATLFGILVLILSMVNVGEVAGRTVVATILVFLGFL